MGFVQGEGRTQGTLFLVCLEELVSDDHICRVIDAFVSPRRASVLAYITSQLLHYTPTAPSSSKIRP
jgi:hypothetical protein